MSAFSDSLCEPNQCLNEQGPEHARQCGILGWNSRSPAKNIKASSVDTTKPVGRLLLRNHSCSYGVDSTVFSIRAHRHACHKTHVMQQPLPSSVWPSITNAIHDCVVGPPASFRGRSTVGADNEGGDLEMGVDGGGAIRGGGPRA